MPAENEGANAAPPRWITDKPGARGAVRMTRMRGGPELTPEEKARQAKEMARRLAGHSRRSDDVEAS